MSSLIREGGVFAECRLSSRAMREWITAALLLATVAVPQQTHNQYEPPNAPGAGQKLLAQFADDWDVVKSFFPQDGAPKVTKGTCKQYMIQDGKFLQSDFIFFDSDGTKTTGTGLSGFAPKRIASPPFGTIRGRRRCRSAKATARSTARTSSCGRRRSIPTVLGARPWRA